jgi:hypothetical protein
MVWFLGMRLYGKPFCYTSEGSELEYVFVPSSALPQYLVSTTTRPLSLILQTEKRFP